MKRKAKENNNQRNQRKSVVQTKKRQVTPLRGKELTQQKGGYHE